MKGRLAREEHHGYQVIVNKLTEGLRREECLCLNCDLQCIFADALFDLCKDGLLALCVTRCPDFKKRPPWRLTCVCGWHGRLMQTLHNEDAGRFDCPACGEQLARYERVDEKATW